MTNSSNYNNSDACKKIHRSCLGNVICTRRVRCRKENTTVNTAWTMSIESDAYSYQMQRSPYRYSGRRWRPVWWRWWCWWRAGWVRVVVVLGGINLGVSLRSADCLPRSL